MDAITAIRTRRSVRALSDAPLHHPTNAELVADASHALSTPIPLGAGVSVADKKNTAFKAGVAGEF